MTTAAAHDALTEIHINVERELRAQVAEMVDVIADLAAQNILLKRFADEQYIARVKAQAALREAHAASDKTEIELRRQLEAARHALKKEE